MPASSPSSSPWLPTLPVFWLATLATFKGSTMTSPLIRASDLQPEEVRWFWPGRIPIGAITLLDGGPGLGKSTIVYDLAARATTGSPMPGCSKSMSPAAVIILQAEDHPQTTMVPRLTTASADVSRIYVCDRSQVSGQLLQLPDSIDVVESKVVEVGARLVVIDPLSSYLKGNLHNEQSVRKALRPLQALAEKRELAVLVVRHLRKSGGRDPVHLGTGSIAIVGMARSSLLVGSDPSSGEQHQHVLALNKSNLASAPSLLYRTVLRGNGTIAIEWRGETSITAQDLALATGPASEPSALQEAMYVLYSLLADGPLRAGDVARRAAEARVTSRTLSRAKQALGVKSIKHGSGRGSYWLWRLPENDRTYRVYKEHDLDYLMDRLCQSEDDSELPDHYTDFPDSKNRDKDDKDDGRLV